MIISGGRCVHKKAKPKGRKYHNWDGPLTFDILRVKGCDFMHHEVHYCKLHSIRFGCCHSGVCVCRCGLRLERPP